MVRQAALGVGQHVGGAAAVQDGRVADEAGDGERGVHELVDHALLEDLLDARPEGVRAIEQENGVMRTTKNSQKNGSREKDEILQQGRDGCLSTPLDVEASFLAARS